MDLWYGRHDSAWDDAQAELFAAGITDGLPVVPPTRERVEQMLAHTGLNGDELITTLPPAFEDATCRDVAINAVMAGCIPAYLPVVGAAIEAIADAEFN